jgi:uncharacterized protein (TIGR02246 family)
MGDTRSAIEAVNEKFMAALTRGDAAGVTALYTADARLLPPNLEMMRGTEAIQSFWQGGIDMGIKEARLETVEVQARDNVAYEIGKYTLTIQPAGGEAITDTGKYLVIWKQQDGSWKLHVDIWNTSVPATV